jgi:fatty acid synthase
MQATSYLVTAWEALAAQQETTMDEMPVIFEDVSIVQAVQAQPGENVTLSVLLDRSHRFQVCSNLVDPAFFPKPYTALYCFRSSIG